ncbi:MAG: hypothetical protein LBN00_10785 [Oscillospiraceae bacterium]|jgi:hypothetical protein|nr:hypothetical protein [Oscillospiraceae bacterium]
MYVLYWFIGISLAIIMLIAMYVFPFLVDRIIIKIKSQNNPDYAEKHKSVHSWMEPLISILVFAGVHGFNLLKGGKISLSNIIAVQNDARQFGLILLLVSGAVLIYRYRNESTRYSADGASGLSRAKKGAVISLILALVLSLFSIIKF